MPAGLSEGREDLSGGCKACSEHRHCVSSISPHAPFPRFLPDELRVPVQHPLALLCLCDDRASQTSRAGLAPCPSPCHLDPSPCDGFYCCAPRVRGDRFRLCLHVYLSCSAYSDDLGTAQRISKHASIMHDGTRTSSSECRLRFAEASSCAVPTAVGRRDWSPLTSSSGRLPPADRSSRFRYSRSRASWA